mgnify:CR=1 FL=1|jgi:hypothetical protein
MVQRLRYKPRWGYYLSEEDVDDGRLDWYLDKNPVIAMFRANLALLRIQIEANWIRLRLFGTHVLGGDVDQMSPTPGQLRERGINQEMRQVNLQLLGSAAVFACLLMHHFNVPESRWRCSRRCPRRCFDCAVAAATGLYFPPPPGRRAKGSVEVQGGFASMS